MAVHGQLRLDIPLDDPPQPSSSSSSSPISAKNRGRSRRERPHIALAADQPPTTQGKPRTRVFVACLQCRRRKIRCDGSKPVCFNCNQRSTGDECCYDTAPKRRGPDRVPGARTRGVRPREGELGRTRRRRARSLAAQSDADASSPTSATSSYAPLSAQALQPPTLPTRAYISPNNTALAEPSGSPPSYASARVHYNLAESARPASADTPSPRSIDSYSPIPQHPAQSHNLFSFVSDNHIVTPPESNARFTAAPVYNHQIDNLAHTPVDLPLPLVRPAAVQNPPVLPLLHTQDLAPTISANSGYYFPPPTSARIESEDGMSDDDAALLAEPSVDFARRTWWDHLLMLYTPPGVPLNSSARDAAARNIFTDFKYLFRATSYWFSFVHVRRFFSSVTDPTRRARMQPSLVLALLSVSRLLQSSVYGEGQLGMRKALALRDEAQSALDRSLNARAIDEELAQAAWILAFFEQCCHPSHEHGRVRGSLHLLDAILRALALPGLDAGNPQASAYERRAVPTVSTSPVPRAPNTIDAYAVHGGSHAGAHRLYPAPASANWHASSLMAPPQPHYVPTQTTFASSPPHMAPTSPPPCNCDALTIGGVDPSAREVTPMWVTQPAWQDEWSEAEIRRESCRRLAWMSMTLVAGYTSYAAAANHPPLDCFIIDPANFNLLFPGEILGSGKNSVWALYVRAMLLWHSCLCARGGPDPEFAMKAWLESEAIENALNTHTCNVERALLYHGREYLFNTRMSISFDFQRYIPQALTGVNRGKSEEWLRTQGRRAKLSAKALSEVSGNPNHTLLQRPHFVWWFMGQVQRALKLWALDKSLTIALDVCRDFMMPIEFLSQVYPCAAQRVRYEELRAHLLAACAEAEANGWVPSA